MESIILKYLKKFIFERNFKCGSFTVTVTALFQALGRNVRGNLVKEDVLGLGIVY